MTSLLIALIVGFVVCQVATLLTTVYLHRALSHRAITVRPWLAFVFRLTLWMTTGLRPREWVAVHRKHHAFTDVDGDPHSPKLLGWPAVQFGNIGLYRKVATDPSQVQRYARDLPQDKWDKVLFDHSWLGLAVGISLLVAVFGPWVGLLAAAFHAGMYLGLNAAVNAITHTFGKRPFDNTATNLQWLAFLTLGEGLHNNHHAAPTSAKFSLNRGNVDPAWPLIKLSRRLGLMTIRHHEVKLKQPAGV
jgi:stearoyl-CoA desaturase (delta-9 desaturase)